MILEFVVFASACLALVSTGYRTLGLALAVIVLAHYAVGYERVLWLRGR